MKVLVISHMYPSRQNPTYGIFVHEQVKALAEQGCELKVLAPVPWAPWPLTALKKKWQNYAAIPAKDVLDGIEVYYPRYPVLPRSFLLAEAGYLMFRGMRQLVKGLHAEFPFDLIHAHVALPDGQAANCLKEIYRVPVVVTIHGQDFQTTLKRGGKIKTRLIEVLAKADQIITVSSKLKKIGTKLGDQYSFGSKIEVVNNGIDLSKVPTSLGSTYVETEQDSAQKNKVRIVSVSNLKKTKGIDLNIQAFAILVKKYPNLEYYIVGDGEERPKLEGLVKDLGLGDRVKFLGRLPHPEALKQIAAADIFSLPSWQEGFGVVYIEAMAQGVPVIGVEGEGIEDAIIHEQNGLLVRPRDVTDLAKALERLLSSPSYAAKLAIAAQSTVRDNFTWQKNAEKTKSLYHTLLNGR
ncbi:MAG: glycosyltransferase family 4 protein [Peptococcaceae bacterium]|nr:glycosyltransferase family 4 protein [Peptococcaceae bacterium]